MNVVITGASKGIGKAIAAGFAAEGATLFLCARNELDLYNTVAELQQKNVSSTINAQVADLSKKDSAKKFGQWILDKKIACDILVNNAGIGAVAPLMDTDENTWDAIMNVNAKGVLLCSQAAARQMIAQGGGGRRSLRPRSPLRSRSLSE
jgi:short-subunit dehydrogenase